MKINGFMKKVFKGCVFLIINSNSGNPLYAQQTDNNVRSNVIIKELFNGAYFSFYANYYGVNNAKIVKESGNYSLRSTKVGGIEGGAGFFMNFNNDYSIITGIHAGAAGRNAGIFISKSDFNPALRQDFNVPLSFGKDYTFYLSAPVWVEKRWMKRNFNHWNADLGVNIRYHPGDVGFVYLAAGQDIYGQTKPVLILEGSVGNNIKPWINYNISGGYSWFLSNYNFLRVNLIADFSATKVVKFDYSIDVSGKPENTGTYSSNLSYLGISINYILTGANKRLLKFYKNNLEIKQVSLSNFKKFTNK